MRAIFRYFLQQRISGKNGMWFIYSSKIFTPKEKPDYVRLLLFRLPTTFMTCIDVIKNGAAIKHDSDELKGAHC